VCVAHDNGGQAGRRVSCWGLPVATQHTPPTHRQAELARPQLILFEELGVHVTDGCLVVAQQRGQPGQLAVTGSAPQAGIPEQRHQLVSCQAGSGGHPLLCVWWCAVCGSGLCRCGSGVPRCAAHLVCGCPVEELAAKGIGHTVHHLSVPRRQRTGSVNIGAASLDALLCPHAHTRTACVARVSCCANMVVLGWEGNRAAPSAGQSPLDTHRPPSQLPPTADQSGVRVAGRCGPPGDVPAGGCKGGGVSRW
jgi:hypothetical protein